MEHDVRSRTDSKRIADISLFSGPMLKSRPLTPSGSLFFTAFDSDDQVLPSDGRPLQSVVMHGQMPITFSAYGNDLELLATERGDVTLTLTKRVCNVEQMKARQSLVRSVRRAREVIDQGQEQLMKIRQQPRSFDECAALEKNLAAQHQSFVKDCTTLKQIWPLEPETANERQSWTLHKDDEGVTAIFLPDLRPGQRGRYIETRFWFGSASTLLTINMPAADVKIVPDCCAPYRPFNVPAVWREEWRQNMCIRTLV